MKKLIVGLVLALSLVGAAVAAPNKLVVVNSDSLQWKPANGLPGAEVAVISGDPTKKEPFIARIKLPANFTIPAHTHAINEYDTVISGVLNVGVGKTVDMNHGDAISAGSFIMIPAKLSHYAWTKEETILQINGVGPWGMIYKHN